MKRNYTNEAINSLREFYVQNGIDMDAETVSISLMSEKIASDLDISYGYHFMRRDKGEDMSETEYKKFILSCLEDRWLSYRGLFSM